MTSDIITLLLTHSESTLKSYKDAITLYVRFLEEIGVAPKDFKKSCFERSFIEKWIEWLKKNRNSSTDSCNVRLASIRVFLEYVGSRDISLIYLYLDAKNIKRQKGMQKKVVTAARLGEILSVKNKQLHLKAQKPYVTIVVKGNKIRTLYLLPKAISHIEKFLLEEHESPENPEAYLFSSRVGGKYGMLIEPAIDKRLKLYARVAHEKCKDIPLNIHAHQFRHAKASHWIEDGLNVLQVSILLGHANLETTMIYLDITTADKIKALATLESEEEKIVSKKWKNLDGTLTDFCGLKR